MDPQPHRALIVVDVQNDFTEGGSLAVSGGDRVAAAVGEYIRGQHGSYTMVVTTQDYHVDPGDHFSDRPDFVASWPAHCVAGTSGAELDPLLGPDLDRYVDHGFYKGQYSAAYSGFEGTDSREGGGRPLEAVLRAAGVESVDIVGIATDHCVRATALDAARAGFDTTVLLEMCAAVDPSAVPTTVSAWQAAGIRAVPAGQERD